jgi:tetratricopeptide (TPR) repeat protein
LKLTFKTAGKIQPWQVILLCLLLFGLVVWVFLPSLNGDFIDIDDGVFVTRNPHINLTPANVAWAFCHPAAANWHPLTMWSLMLDHQFYGLNPWGFHLTNVLLHAVNTVLVFLVLRRMTGAIWRSLMVAALFGLHPLRVESVVWISERKDVLSMLFWMLTLWAYVRYAPKKSMVEGRESKATTTVPDLDSGLWTFDYVLALSFFALGLMSKPMVVTLPCVLLLLDYWPLERWKQKRLRGLVGEKTPFFLLAAIMSAATYVIQKNVGEMSVLTSFSLSFGARLGNALVSYGRYLGKLFWPVDLCALYLHPGHWPTQKILFAGLLVLGLSILGFVMRRQQPYLLMGWLWYLGTLVPAIGLVQVGGQSMADRYTYIPSIGILIALVWGTCQMPRRWHYQSLGLGTAGGALTLVCIGLTRHQIGYWKDDVSVWQQAVAVTEKSHDPQNRLGLSQGRLAEEIPYYNLGAGLNLQRRFDEAIGCYQKALEINPNFAEAHNNLGTTLNSQGRLDEAIGCFQKALKINPYFAEAHNNLGTALYSQGRLDEAIREFQEVLRLKPDRAETHCNLGFVLGKQGRLDEAIREFQEALRLKPDYATAHNNLILALGLKKKQANQPAFSSKP